MDDSCDIFVSYKAENANIVRTIVENLIAQGIRVWFAEYEVLLANYDEFQDAIDAGIDRSRYLVAFTNRLWAMESEYCVPEVQRFLSRVPTGHLLEVGIPTEPHPRMVEPRLRAAPHLTYAGDGSDVLRFLADNTDLPISTNLIEPNPIRTNRWKEDRFGISLNLHGFLPNPELTLEQRAGWVCGFFHGTIERHSVRMAVFCSPFDPVVRTAAEPMSQIGNDHELAAAYRQYGRGFSQDDRVQIIGLHLVWLGGLSQMGLSYISQPAELLTVRDVERRYIITVRGNRTGPMGEIGVLFAVRIAQHDNASTLLARLAPTFDAIVQSIEYQPPVNRTDPLHLPTIAVKVATVACAALAWKYVPPEVEYAVPVGLVLGVSVGDLSHTLVSRKFLRLSTVFQETMYLRELTLGLRNGYTIIAVVMACIVMWQWQGLARVGWLCAGCVWAAVGGLKEANRRPTRKLRVTTKPPG